MGRAGGGWEKNRPKTQLALNLKLMYVLGKKFFFFFLAKVNI